MKRPTILLFLALGFCLSSTATTYRINNTPGSSAPYNDLTTAQAVASAGDTLLIEGSTTPYGTLTINKQLVVLGPGYFLDENPGTPVSLPAIVNTFTLERNGGPLTGAAGTEIRGLSFTQSQFSNIDVEVSNVIIAKNLLNSPVHIVENDVFNTQVIQNFFIRGGISSSQFHTGHINLTFANNIVGQDFFLVDNSSGAIEHNLFLGDDFVVQNFVGEIRSNIAKSTSTNNFIVTSAGSGMITDNTAGNGQFGNTNGNNTVPFTSLVVGPTGNSTDGQYQLLPNAPLVLGTAHDGTDRGSYGGALPYCLSGLGDMPIITTIMVPPNIGPGMIFSVSLTAKSGN